MAEEGEIKVAPAVAPPATARKPRKPRARKPKQEAAAKPVETTARFVEVKTRRSGAASLVVSLVAVCVVAGAGYYGWQQLTRLRQESSKRDSELGMQVSTELAGLQAKFDSLMTEWDKQRREKELLTTQKNVEFAALGIRFDYRAALGDAIISESNVVTFSGNPDLTISAFEPDEVAKACTAPLRVTKDGYCDETAIDGIQRVERVYAEYNEDDSLSRVVLAFSWIINDESVLRLTADLGTPALEGRDVFAPADAQAQAEQVEAYYRMILKGETISVAVDENITYAREIAASLRLISP